MSPKKISKQIESLSLKSRLFVLLLLTLLPFISFSIYKALDIYGRLESDVQTENLKIAKTIAHDIDEYITATGEVLVPISKNEHVRNQNYPAVEAYFREVVPQYPYYHLIAFVDTEGNVRAAAMSDIMANSEDAERIQLNVKDTACYVRGIKSGGISIGDFMYSKLTGIPVVHVTYPVFDYSGKRIGFVAAAFDLTKIQKKIMRVNSDKPVIISVVDEKGVYIARNTEPGEWVGKGISSTERFKEMLGKSGGTYKAISSDKTTRVYGFATTSLAPWYVRAGVNYSFIQMEVKKELLNHFAVFVPFFLVALLGWIWIGRDVDMLHRRTEYLTLVDPLTELWNCRKLDHDFCRELSLAKRQRGLLAFAMIDIDHFKQYNDHNGHPLGDEALRNVAEILRETVRDTDLVYRYGGEEMCVILPNTDKEGAALVLERIREEVEKAYFIGEENQPSGKLTISIGFATYPIDSISKEGLIKSADNALYRAKESGRNRVEAADEGEHWEDDRKFYPFSECTG